MNFAYFNRCMTGYKKKGCISYESLTMADKKKLYLIVKHNMEKK